MPTLITNYYPFYIAIFILTILFVNAFKKPAEIIVLLDIPGGRKKHSGAIPLIGGAAIFFSFICVSFFLNFPLREYSSLYLGAGILLITGIIDDLNEIKAKTRFLVQILVALIMTSWADINIVKLGNLFGYGNIYLDVMSTPLTIFLIVGYINAINMIDGADGLAGGLLFIMGLSLFIISLASDYNSNSIVLLGMLISAIFAFLFYNYRHPWRHKASVFMGDSGSMSLGYILIWFAIDITQDDRFNVQPICITWMLVLPLFDAFAIITRRIFSGKHPFSGDRHHIHHILNRYGFSEHKAVNLILITSILFSIIGYIGWNLHLPEYYLNYLLFSLFFIYIYYTTYKYKKRY